MTDAIPRPCVRALVLAWALAGCGSTQDAGSDGGDLTLPHDVAPEARDEAVFDTGSSRDVALDAGMGQWVRMSLRELVRACAAQNRPEDATTFLGAARRDAPAAMLEPAIVGPLESSCRAALGEARFEHLAAEGAALTLDQISDRVGAH